MAVPNWDRSKSVPSGAIAGDVSAFNSSDQGDLGGHALWLQAMGTTGGRADLGVFPAWYVRYLFTFDPGAYRALRGMAEVSGYVPIHYRESASSLFFDSGRSVDAFGLPLSINARPTFSLLGGGTAENPADRIVPVGTTTTNGWAWDLAHEPAFAYLPYLITGDWYFLEELYFYAANALAASDAGFCTWCRGGSFGYLTYAVQTRGQAWGLRDLAHAAFMAPDGSAERAYFNEKLNANIEIEEGQQGVTNGAFPPSDPACSGYAAGPGANKWCYGRVTVATNPDKGNRLKNTLNFPNWGNSYTNCNDGRLNQSGDSYACVNSNAPWQMHYKFNVLGHIQELGFPIGALNQALFRFLLHMVEDPAFNPWLSGTYIMPIVQKSTNDYYQTWGDLLRGFSTSYVCDGVNYNPRTYQGWIENCGSSGSGDTNVSSPGYPHIAKAAASYLAGFNITDGSLRGSDAWNWMVANVGSQNLVGMNPQYALLPRTSTPPPVTSACDLNRDGVTDVQDVQAAINGSLDPSLCTAGDLDRNGRCDVVDVQRVINTALGGTCQSNP
jgi:hypothetical protein